MFLQILHLRTSCFDNPHTNKRTEVAFLLSKAWFPHALVSSFLFWHQNYTAHSTWHTTSNTPHRARRSGHQPSAVAMAHTQCQTHDKGLLWQHGVRSAGTETLELTVQSPNSVLVYWITSSVLFMKANTQSMNNTNLNIEYLNWWDKGHPWRTFFILLGVHHQHHVT